MTGNSKFYIKFFAPVVPESVAALMQIVDNKLKAGAKKLGLLISSSRGYQWIIHRQYHENLC